MQAQSPGAGTPLLFLPKLVAAAAASTAVILAGFGLLELARRSGFLGLPWGTTPDREVLVLRAVIINACQLTAWVTLRLFRQHDLIDAAYRRRLAGAYTFVLALTWVGLGVKFLDGNSQSVETLDQALLAARLTAPFVTAYLIYAFVQAYFKIEKRLAREQELSSQLYLNSTTDSLTGLPNRMLYQDRFEVALAQARRFKQQLAVVFIDIDRFKLVNDSLGHTDGDTLLRELAQRLKDCLRVGDSLCRVNGDEFLVFLSGLSQPDVDVPRVTARLLEEVSRPHRLGKQEVILTASVGVSFFPGDGQDVETLVKNADTAMGRAKQRGGNQVMLYQAEMNASAVQRLNLEKDLRLALARQELVVFYQPQLDTRTRKIVGAEALVRWKHPERGMVSPAEFIPLAESAGLIVPIDRWVMSTACAQMRRWRAAGFQGLRLAVNLSARQFQTDDLEKAVADTLAETAIEPGLLELELTESAGMQNPTSTAQLLHRLKALGVRVAIDDFGTGYSSLSYLKRFPVDTLKIDRSMLSDLTSSEGDAAIITAIIAMGHSLKLKLVAEGVETEEQLGLLRALNCDEVQGFLFSRPVDAESFERLLREEEAAIRIPA